MTPRTWLLSARHLFGKVPDHEIARSLGVERTIVSKARRRLGIPFVRNDHQPGRPLTRVQPLLGKLSDREIARQMEIHFKTTGEARRALGIHAATRGPAGEYGTRYTRTSVAPRLCGASDGLLALKGVHR